MNNKPVGIIIAIIIVAGLAVGGYELFNNSSKPTAVNPSHTILSNASINNSVLKTRTSSSIKGQYLTDPNGQTLYTYSQDKSNISFCTGSCLSLWPPYIDNGSTTNLPQNVGTIKRTDTGQIQFTYKTKPLYFYVGDKQAGAVTGNGVAGFYVARP